MQATVRGVAKSRTRLSDFTFTFPLLYKAYRFDYVPFVYFCFFSFVLETDLRKLRYGLCQKMFCLYCLLGALSGRCCCSVAQWCLALCDPMDCSTPGSPVCHQLPELAQLMSIESVMPSNHVTLCHPLLLPPSIFPSTRVFSNELTLFASSTKVLEFQLQHQSFQ